MAEIFTQDTINVLINAALVVTGLALKSYFPMVFPFFDKNKETIKELLRAINLTPEDNEKIAARAEAEKLNRAAAEIRKV